MFSLKKYRSMHVTTVTKKVLDSLTKWSSCLKKKYTYLMQLFYANQSIRNMRDISNATYDRPIPSIGTIFNIISKSLVFGIVGCIATHNALICLFSNGT
jgi:hypothetical protein